MATEEMSVDFDDLDPVDVPTDDNQEDAEWLDLEEGEAVVGEIREIKENCGEHDSRVYKIARGLGDVVLLWGKASIDRQVDSDPDIGVGTVVGIKNTGKEFETKSGYTGVEYDVRKA